VEIRPRAGLFALPPCFVLGFAAVVPALVPASQRHMGLLPFALGMIGTAAAMSVLMSALWWPRRHDAVLADEAGLRVTSGRRGDRRLSWNEITELGWVGPGGADLGLVAVLKGEDEPRWLCNPAGRVYPRRALRQLAGLAAAHGARWQTGYRADMITWRQPPIIPNPDATSTPAAS
jgi:hypothetical protein